MGTVHPRSTGFFNKVADVGRNVIPTINKHKTTIIGTLSGACGLASFFAPPPANAICLGASRFLGGVGVLTGLKDSFDKLFKKTDELNEKSQGALKKRAEDIVTGLGGHVPPTIELKDVSQEDKAKMSTIDPVMDQETGESFDQIKDWIARENRSKFDKKQDNYDCVYMHGPPGTGKTIFAKALFRAVPDKYDFKMANITAGDLLEQGAGKLKRLKENIIAQIEEATDKKHPICIGFFLDEVEGSLTKDRSANPGVVNEYLTFVNEIKDAAANNPNVYVLGALATNFDHLVDNASKRDGRVTHRLHINYPTPEVKKDLIKFAVKGLDIAEGKQGDVTKMLQEDHAVLESLKEERLTGASIVEAMKQTKRDMELKYPALSFTKILDQNKDEFAKTFAGHLTKSAKKATKERIADEKENLARQGMIGQLGRMAAALEKKDGGNQDIGEALKGITDTLKEMTQKIGDNTQLKEIMNNMGQKFEEMQTTSKNDRDAVILELQVLIKQIAANATSAALASALAVEKAGEASEKAGEASKKAGEASLSATSAADAGKTAAQEVLRDNKDAANDAERARYDAQIAAGFKNPNKPYIRY